MSQDPLGHHRSMPHQKQTLEGDGSPPPRPVHEQGAQSTEHSWAPRRGAPWAGCSGFVSRQHLSQHLVSWTEEELAIGCSRGTEIGCELATSKMEGSFQRQEQDKQRDRQRAHLHRVQSVCGPRGLPNRTAWLWHRALPVPCFLSLSFHCIRGLFC